MPRSSHDPESGVDVTVVVVVWNSAAHLVDFLSTLPEAMDGVGTWQFVVADNASSDDSLAIVAHRAPDATVVQLGRNAGYAAGLNAGIRAAQAGRAVLVLNPDVKLMPGSVPLLLDALEEAGTGLCAPRILSCDGTLAPSLRREPTVRRALGEAVLGGTRAGRIDALGEMVLDEARYERPGTSDWATGAALLISRECLDAVGPFDESFFLYSEETEFALRARDAGFRLAYVPNAVAVHRHGESATDPHLYALLTVNRARLFARRNGPLRALAFRGALVLGEALRSFAGHKTHQAALRALLRRGVPAPGGTRGEHAD